MVASSLNASECPIFCYRTNPDAMLSNGRASAQMVLQWIGNKATAPPRDRDTSLRRRTAIDRSAQSFSTSRYGSALDQMPDVVHVDVLLGPDAVLSNKFRTVTTIENAIPSIWFSSRKNKRERPQLNYSLLDPEVTKLRKRDSHNAEAVYIVSNGRNRMQIEIFKGFDFVGYDYDKECSKLDDVYDVVIKFSTIEAPMSPRKKVEIIDDSWIEALKFLSFAQWSKAFFVSRQISGLVQRNVARLPCIVINSATVYGIGMEKLRPPDQEIIARGDKIASNVDEEFFTQLGISLDAPADIQHNNAIIGVNVGSITKFEWLSLDSYSRECASMEIHVELAGHWLANGTIFLARFDQNFAYSWAAMKYFLEFLYHPASYVKELEMIALNRKLIDACFGGAERFIRCGLYKWNLKSITMTAVDLGESLSWLEKNIRAETIQFPQNVELMGDYFYDRISIFLLDSSWKCARKEVKFEISNMICGMNRFLEALVKKFRSVSFVRNDIPMFKASTYGNDETMSLLLDPGVLKLKSDDSQGAEVYIISNGDNRMQIEIFKRSKFEENKVDNYVDLGDSDSDDSYYSEEEYVKYVYDPRTDGNDYMFDVNVNVYHV